MTEGLMKWTRFKPLFQGTQVQSLQCATCTHVAERQYQLRPAIIGGSYVRVCAKCAALSASGKPLYRRRT
jgi:hypothetical protein